MSKPNRIKAAELVRDAGGRIVGRTRLQKVAYLLEIAGLGDGFQFAYHHYGPYSDELAEAIQLASVFDLVNEEEHATNWGGKYSTYTYQGDIRQRPAGARAQFAEAAAGINAVELELAATAVYLRAEENSDDPWDEAALLKPEKAAEGRLDNAKAAYQRLRKIVVPKPLPAI